MNTITKIAKLFFTAIFVGLVNFNVFSQCLTYSIQDVTCNGASNGSVTITINNPGTEYTFSIFGDFGSRKYPPAGSSYTSNVYTFTNINVQSDLIIVGQYKVGGVFLNCPPVFTSISEPPAISASGSVTNVSCNGGNNGAINLTVSGGTPGYTYSWSNGQTTEDISSLTAGNYTVIITDSKGCNDTASFSVTQPIPVPADAGPNAVICNGSNTVLNASGGVSYLWNPGGQTTQSITVSPAATTTYTVTVTDNNGCSNNDQVTVTVNSLPAAAPTAVPAAICRGGSSTLNANPSGNAPFTYSWAPGGQTSQTISVSPAATTTYTVTVTDNNGCSINANVTLTINQPPTVSASVPSPVCKGTANPITTTVSGNGPFTFAWSPAAGLNNASIQNPIANPAVTTTYTVTVTDANGCQNTASVNIVVNQLPVVAPTAAPAVMCSGNSSSLTANASGGSGTYTTYNWAPAASLSSASIANPTANPATTTTYSVTVTDDLGCVSAPKSVTLTVNPLPTVSASAASPICNGFSTTLTAVGGAGTAPYTYSWSPAATVSNPNAAVTSANPVVTTTYTVTITDSKGCISSANATVVVNQPPTVSATAPAICKGNSSLITTTIAGNGPFTYSWAPAATLNNASLQNPTASPAATTTYTVTVTDNNGCVNNASATVVVNQPPTVSASAPAICNGNSSLITTTVTGNAPFTFAWLPAASLDDATLQNPTASPAVTTTYTVTVTDANGCANAAAPVTVVVNQLPVVAPAAAPAVICSGSSSSLTANASGGSGTYTTYNWAPAASLSSASVANPTANPAATTTYSVTVTDNLGCVSAPQSITLTVNPLPTVSASATSPICNGSSTTLTAVGGTGTAPYTYSWSPAATVSNPNAAVTSANPVVTTTYTVTITDSKGCISSATATVVVNQPPTVSASAPVICNGKSSLITTTVSGSAPFTFAWLPAASLDDATLQNPTASPAATTTYTVTVTDANGCANASASVTVVVNQLPVVAPAAAPAVICSGSSSSLAANASGGSGTYTTYNWAPVASLSSASVANPTANPVATTTYSVTVTDNLGCVSAPQSVTLTVNPLPAAAPTATPAAICPGGSSTLDANPSGNGPFTYAWALGGQTSQTVSVSPAATTTYTVTVTDANGCVNNASTTVVVNQPPTVSASAPAICNGKSSLITTTVTGNAPFTFAWLPAASLDDATLQNPTASPAATTTYTVTVTDANGCANASASVTVVVNPLPVVAPAAAPAVICSGNSSSLIANASGGSGTYTTYIWAPATSLSSSSVANPTANPVATTTYSVTVTDNLGCVSAPQPVTLTVNPLPTAAPAASPASICPGGSSTLDANPSGNGPFTYAWAPGGQTSQTVSVSPATTTTYTVTVTDNNGCAQTASVSVRVFPIPIIFPTASPSAICLGDSTRLDAGLQGGNIPPPSLSYLWAPGGKTDPDIYVSPASTTTYTLTVTNPFGCSNNASVTVIVNPLPTVTPTTNPAIICSGSSSSLTANASGGSGTYTTYNWAPATSLSSSSVANPTANPVATTTYSVTVTDNLGCVSAPQSVTLTVNPLPTTAPTAAPASICPGGSSTLDPNPSGNGPFTYAWAPGGQTSQTVSVSPAATTTYTVTVTDANGCVNTASTTVVVNQPPIVSANAPVICNGNSSLITTTVSGSAPFTFAWLPAASLDDATLQNPTASPAATTIYTVTVTDANGCANASASVTVVVNQLPVVAPTAAPAVICSGSSSSLAANASGGSGTYTTYNWAPATSLSSASVANPIANPASTTTYTVIVTDNLGCVSSPQSLTLTVNPIPTGTASVVPNNICKGSGTIVTASFDPGFTPAAANAYSFDGGNTFQDNSIFAIASVNSDTTVIVILTDINGCRSRVIPVNITVKKINAITSQQSAVTCFGANDGIALINVVGGNAGYTFTIDGGAFQAGNTFSGLAPGNHIITAMDADGCPADFPVTITQPAILTLAVSFKQDINPCAGSNNGIITVTSTGGNGGNQYTISGLGITQPGTTFNNLAPGTYTITVKDANNCTAKDSATIISPPGIDVAAINTLIKKDNICHGKKEGHIILDTNTIQGGIKPFTYNLNGSIKAYPDYDLLFAGSDIIVITDANGCVFNYPFTIGEPSAIQFFTTTTPDTCSHKDGSIAISNPTGGVGGYTFSLGGVSYGSSQVFSNLAANIYQVFVKDANNCTAGQPVIIIPNPGPIPYIHITPPLCNGEKNGFVVIDSLEGGIAPYLFSIDTGRTFRAQMRFDSLGANIYSMIIKDQVCTYNVNPFFIYNDSLKLYDTVFYNIVTNYHNTGRTDTLPGTFIINQPAPISALSYSSMTNKDAPVGMVGLYSVMGGTSPYQYSIDDVNYTNFTKPDSTVITGLSKGKYTVYIKDSHGCKIDLSLFIDIQFFIPNLITPNGDNVNDKFEVIGLPINSELRIYNRWGERIYENKNYDNTWDGDKAPDGVYYYDLVLPAGTFYKGWVEIMNK
jgi:gliding motility-associated-like protein